ncbi:endoplasmic reticulum membrane sensor NFE2L1-like isoform X1 [Haliotis asinina]|uniref:endoplasmic reticulum membrane sensor NFE2L1-like isoform X1 n=1 Tax=Haliotis asinina TaxID=109174 RepID=UPI0035318B83
MIKQYFTDGLIQIAIILSLLRTDLNNWHLHNNYINYPEVQDIILGQSFAYTTTNFHNQYNNQNSPGGSVHPKNVDNDFFSSIFRDLRSLSRFRRFDGIATEVNAFLVSETTFGLPATAASGPQTHSSEDSNNNNHAHPAIPNAETSASLVQENVDNQASTSEGVCSVNDDDSAGAVGVQPPSEPGSEPTDEDLDLIEVLWRQDIDLGVGKEVFDINLRRELERDRELELQKKREKQKELELIRLKAEEEKRQQQQQWLSQNFMQDGETGEWVPLNGSVSLQSSPVQMPPDVLTNSELLNSALSLEEALDILHAETGTFVDPSYTVPDNNTQLPMPPQSHISPTGPSVETFLLETDNYTTQTVQQPPQHLSPNLNRQESLDQHWDDLVSLLDLAGVNSSQLNITNVNPTQLNMSHLNTTSTGPQMNVTNINTPSVNITTLNSMAMNLNNEVNTTSDMSSPSVQSPCINNNVLLQNATMPAPVANVTVPVPVTNTTQSMSPINNTGFLPPSQEFNSSVPNTDTIGGLDWEASEMLFSNVTGTVNQTEGLEDIDGILPDFLPEDELDLAINEGLQTMQMLDEASSDSAVSMGSASPMQDLSESNAMSPFDGLEGATGGSDYGSPTYSKTSKYDPEEYRYSYSCSFSHSDSSQTNYSTSSNDTDVNKPLGGNNHINHNHTYPLKPGASPKEIKTSTKTDKPKTKGPHARDQKRALELNVPFSVEQIIESPVEEFNEMITKYKLTEPQIQLIRDIRRRGKNKVAAQNCRKRKLDVVITLEDEMDTLKEMKEKLMRERQQIDKQTREMKEKFSHMYQEIFHSLRDEHGRPYDPNEYSLQQSSDGNVFLVPRNYSTEDQLANGNKKRKNIKKED